MLFGGRASESKPSNAVAKSVPAAESRLWRIIDAEANSNVVNAIIKIGDALNEINSLTLMYRGGIELHHSIESWDIRGGLGAAASIMLSIPGTGLLARSAVRGGVYTANKIGLFSGAGSVTKGVDSFAHAARNRTMHEIYKSELRQGMERPLVSDPKLQRIIDKLYRPNSEVGSGSTADAIRYELSTGEMVKGKYHLQKGQDTIRFLEGWSRNNPIATSGDRAVVENLIHDLNDAMGYGKRWYPKKM